MSTAHPAAAYGANGFYIHPECILPASLVQAASEGMDQVRRGRYNTGRRPSESPWNPGDDPNVLCKIENPQFANRAIRTAISHPALGEFVSKVVCAEWIQVWWVQLLYKPPATEESKPAVGWHRDRAYWEAWTEDSNLFTIWLAMSDITPESGPMTFVPGSHLWETESGGDFFSTEPDLQKGSIRVPDGKVWREVPAVMGAGGFSVHHNKTFHGSGPNNDSQPRKSFAIHARTDRSQPVGQVRNGLTEYIDDYEVCPVIFGG